MLMVLKILLRRKLTKTYTFSLKINVIRSCEFLQRFSGKKGHQKESKEEGRRLNRDWSKREIASRAGSWLGWGVPHAPRQEQAE